jgi:hypothetical protein
MRGNEIDFDSSFSQGAKDAGVVGAGGTGAR